MSILIIHDTENSSDFQVLPILVQYLLFLPLYFLPLWDTPHPPVVLIHNCENFLVFVSQVKKLLWKRHFHLLFSLLGSK